MKRNTVKNEIGIEVYQTKIHEIVDQYLFQELEDPKDIIGNSALFTGLMKYIYINIFKPDKNTIRYNNANTKLDTKDIDGLNDIWNIYTSLCYRYKKRPTLLNFSVMTGIDNHTFVTWLDGSYRTGTSETGRSWSATVKSWKSECESTLLDGAIENNSIGCIFALKANHGYTEAPQQVIVTGSGTPQLSADDLARLRAERQPEALPEKPVIDI